MIQKIEPITRWNHLTHGSIPFEPDWEEYFGLFWFGRENCWSKPVSAFPSDQTEESPSFYLSEPKTRSFSLISSCKFVPLLSQVWKMSSTHQLTSSMISSSSSTFLAPSLLNLRWVNLCFFPLCLLLMNSQEDKDEVFFFYLCVCVLCGVMNEDEFELNLIETNC